eukprot:TRINITY_DN2478_c0_g1::TRINITY_DN2478_c0_g1_i1::g.8957::m.8957 TRINITY_DN2478_c0_g1::TRINITY_DN2478_c0_g1_i1::g.8957  ORF type:complete len:436 (+),score=173.97,sp/P51174/ACADL_MOUSE/59.90/5e-176,Acyl-CoA_dh_1/PF00441.19/3.3e-44,Acyl-CoA_dh_N/PF02771.11/5e-30,Acyl-CoA_dh_M/PF02770.14/4.3e-19,Acyl-CoA_dh_2/PF08028.6/1.3e-10,CBM_X2/PF03442.9/0.01,Acyl-CoA_ox_N/PF14749.1/0.17 TRINITY_DN2478_c0_g1_i1:45-1310(+)
MSVVRSLIRSTGSSVKSLGVRSLASDAGAKLRPEPYQAPNLTQVGTRRIMNPDLDMFRETCRKFINEQVKPHHDKWEEQGYISRECWEAAGETGLLGANAPAEYGGSESGVIAAAIVWEELSYAGTTGPGFPLHSDIVIPYLLHYGSKEQKEKYIPDLISGKKIGAIAMSEPAAGSDLQGIKTTALKDGSDYILNGSKTFITNGYMADLVIVVAKTDPAAGAKGVSLFLVDAGTPGFSKGKRLKKLGFKAQDTSELFFDNVRLPKSAMLGKEGTGFIQLMKELPQERLIIAVSAIAASEACFEWTRQYVKDRKAFGKSILNFQTIQHKLAEIKTKCAVGRSFADTCLELHDQGRLDTSTASMAKYWLSDLQNEIANECVQLHGGYGFMLEYPVTRMFADARVQKIYGGTNEIMKELIARTL